MATVTNGGADAWDLEHVSWGVGPGGCKWGHISNELGLALLLQL